MSHTNIVQIQIDRFGTIIRRFPTVIYVKITHHSLRLRNSNLLNTTYVDEYLKTSLVNDIANLKPLLIY